ncbi:MAG: copper resistance protein NlpE N-terminal domain-containing protein [Tannerellaceae bacterium]|nr:copper resistance protein NlpE N-terminal domain-containing protein [Tannerellaceae bacterium]
MKYLLFLCMSAFLMTACNNKKNDYSRNGLLSTDQELRDDDEVVFRTGGGEVDSLGYYGVYEGSQWDGAQTYKAKLTLFENNRYRIDPVDLGDGVMTDPEEGTFLIFGDLLTLTPDGTGKDYYFNTDNNDLHRLDDNKQKMVGQHATNFKLIRDKD